jgi:hypothetical protein
MPAISGTVTPSLAGGSVDIVLGTPPVTTGGVIWYVYWKGRGESGFKRQPARRTVNTLTTKIPIPSHRGQFFTQGIDSTGAVFTSPVQDIYPRGGTPGNYTHMIHPELIGFGANGQGAAKAISYTIGDGLAVNIVAPVDDILAPLGSGLTQSNALSVAGNLKNYSPSAATVANEGKYLNGLAY